MSAAELEDCEPIGRPCYECGAEPHEECRPACTGHDEMDQ